MPHRHLIAANWKMNGLKSQIPVAQAIAAESRKYKARVALFPPYTLLPLLADALEGTGIILGGQDCHHADGGAYTGDICAAMLKDCGADMVLLGHSERRHGHLEPCALVARKAIAALKAGLEPVICIGETLEQRRQGLTAQVLSRQLTDSLPEELKTERFHISYEPVWAIGSGLIATDQQILEAFALIRSFLSTRFNCVYEPQLLYGGSVKAATAEAVLAIEGVSGALVGGASLKVEDFMPIVEAADKAPV
jgi:triosephosphate isomerase (TIM)